MSGQKRIILVDPSEASSAVLMRRLSAQGYLVEAASDAAAGANMALSAPPIALIADLWMPSISGVQLCRLLRAEPATTNVPVILRGEANIPRNRFWAERAGASAFVHKGRMGELVRALAHAVQSAPASDAFFMQLEASHSDIRDRIARHLDAALFDSVIAAEVRSLAVYGSFERVFDLLSQLMSRLVNYRWMAVTTRSPSGFGLHHHPVTSSQTEADARRALGVAEHTAFVEVADEDAHEDDSGPDPIVFDIPFGQMLVGKLAIAPLRESSADADSLCQLVARELGGPLRMASLMDEQQRLAMSDPLTSLMNRRSFVAQVKLELSRCHRYQMPLSMLLLDIDHFKSINDTYGHSAGDQVLVGVGALLRNSLRTSDISARWGGEEFVLALTNTDQAGAQVLAERLRAAIEGLSISHEGQRIAVAGSLGLAEYVPAESFESLMDRADRAMYEAKTRGRNRVVTWQDTAGPKPQPITRELRPSEAPACVAE